MINTTYSIREDGGVIETDTPYDADFVAAAKRLRGKYSGGGKWIFPARQRERIAEVCEKIWGAEDEEMVLVEITANKYLWNTCGPVTFGRHQQIAYAKGRDSGAKLAEGVAQLSGKIGSSGSRKNWETVVTEGSVFELRVPASRARDDYDSDWTVKLVADEPTPDERLAELRAEEARLMQRMTDVDAEIRRLQTERKPQSSPSP